MSQSQWREKVNLHDGLPPFGFEKRDYPRISNIFVEKADSKRGKAILFPRNSSLTNLIVNFGVDERDALIQLPQMFSDVETDDDLIGRSLIVLLIKKHAIDIVTT